MASLRKNNALYIDHEALSALTFVKEGFLYPITSLMNKEQMLEALKTNQINGKTIPFPFILAPAGRKNQEILSTTSPNEVLDLVCDGKVVGKIDVEEIYAINPIDRVRQIYGTHDSSHPGVAKTLKRIGKLAVSGEYTLFESSLDNKEIINKAKARIDAKHTSAIMMAANPLHRGHERLIRQTLDSADLLVIFLLRPHNEANLHYDLRYKCLRYFTDNFLPKNRVVILPLDYNYLFAGYNEVIIDAIVAKNHGCDELVIGQNHAGVGLYYHQNMDRSLIDQMQGIDIHLEIRSEYVYCDECKTLVSTKTCPHGQHHQISYHADSILELMQLGLLPPAVLIRKEISAIVLAELFPKRFQNLEKLFYDLLPMSGLLEERSEKDFYNELMRLYQTTSLT